jgi:hypothetical protein
MMYSIRPGVGRNEPAYPAHGFGEGPGYDINLTFHPWVQGAFAGGANNTVAWASSTLT